MLGRAMSVRQEDAKKIAVEFFQWWNDQPKTNTEQGFREWWFMNHTRFREERNADRKDDMPPKGK